MPEDYPYVNVPIRKEIFQKLQKAKLLKSAEDGVNYSWGEYFEYLLEKEEK